MSTDPNWSYQLPEALIEQCREIQRQCVEEAEKADGIKAQIAPLQEEFQMHVRRAMMLRQSMWPKIFEAVPEVSDVSCSTDKPLNLNFETGLVTIGSQEEGGLMGALKRMFGGESNSPPGGGPAS